MASQVPRTITFIITEDCQLRCRYCYLVGKNGNNKMNFTIAKNAIDYILSEKHIFIEGSVVFEFIGGEPLLEIELMDKICDYFKIRSYELNHPWFNSYFFSFTTNGILYNDYRVRKFIEKNKTHLNIVMSIDGTETKHNLNRIYPNGKGSYGDVVKNIKPWLNDYPDASTKVTISSEDIPYISESVMHLFSLGINKVDINVVYENVWRDGDDKLFEEQLIKLADNILINKFFLTKKCSFFSEIIGKPIFEYKNWCGTGSPMLAVDWMGNFYPCNRFTSFSLRNKQPRILGNIFDGIDLNKLRPFIALDYLSQSPDECLKCEIASGCAWCQGENYDSAETETIFQRATFICKMHKARVNANNYYWEKFRKIN